MEFDAYQAAAWNTAVYEGRGSGSWMALAYTALGAAGEAGEIANKVKKVNRDDGMEVSEERRQQILNEVGDCLWYLAAVCTELNESLDGVARFNILRLGARAASGSIVGDGDER